MAEHVVVKNGTTTTELTYGDYQDWNNQLNKIEAFYAGKMIERRNGAVVRDLTTVETETGQVYVVMPVPASVRSAITVTAVLAVAIRAEPSAIQTRILGQGSAARHVDEQGRSGHDLPTAGDPAARLTQTHLPDG
jgi:hypothetical protein